MKYVVVFTYMDGEELEIDVADSDMERFMNTIGSAEVYFNASKGVGVWVAIDKIRYFHVERVDEHGKRVITSHTAVSRQASGDQPPAKGFGEEGSRGMGEALQAAQA